MRRPETGELRSFIHHFNKSARQFIRGGRFRFPRLGGGRMKLKLNSDRGEYGAGIQFSGFRSSISP